MYRYGMSEYGKEVSCDVCGQNTRDSYYQREERHYSFDHKGKNYSGWTYNKCQNLFGHKDCLEKKRRW